ncbi:MAG TPA: acetamidase/formamidase family protein [Bacillota bacterium]|nr:acetamidase/formamidase family protein [Bacillota bacterium]
MVRIGREHFITRFGPELRAVAEVEPGGTAVFETHDCWHGQLGSEDQRMKGLDFTVMNPATGPLGIIGAKPGDTLAVKVLSIRTGRTGLVSILPGDGVLGHMVKESKTRMLPIEDGKVIFDGIAISAVPMVGVMGVAASGDEAGDVSTATPGRHGGNMDTKDVREGATVYFPVRQYGALLAMGDVHALMGDGEVCVTGCETEAEVEVRVDIAKRTVLDWPAIDDGESFMIVASAEDLDKAAEEATAAAVSLISRTQDIPWEEAYMLASLAVDLRISQCVDPRRTVRAVIPHRILKRPIGL